MKGKEGGSMKGEGEGGGEGEGEGGGGGWVRCVHGYVVNKRGRKRGPGRTRDRDERNDKT